MQDLYVPKFPPYVGAWLKLLNDLSKKTKVDKSAVRFGINQHLFQKAREKDPKKYQLINFDRSFTLSNALSIVKDLIWIPHELYKYPFPIDLILTDSYLHISANHVKVIIERTLDNLTKVLSVNIEITDENKFDVIRDLCNKNIHAVVSEFLIKRSHTYATLSEKNVKLVPVLPYLILRNKELLKFIRSQDMFKLYNKYPKEILEETNKQEVK